MEDLSALLACGKIYDGCTVRAIGTVRCRNGEVYIESMRSLVDIGGASFEKLCTGEVECSPKSAVLVEDKRPIAEIDKEMEDMKMQLQEVSSKNANLTQELFKALLLIESLTKQLDTDQNFATNTILDLTSTIMDLKSKLKEATESAASIHTEVEHLRKVEAEHRAIINSLQSDIHTFEGDHAAALAKILAEQQAEKRILEKQIASLCEELTQKSSLDSSDNASNGSAPTDDMPGNAPNNVHKSTKSKLRKLFGKKSATSTIIQSKPQQIGAHRTGNAAS